MSHKINYKTKFIIIRDDIDHTHLRRPIISEYISKTGTNFTIEVTISRDVNNNISIINHGDSVQLYDRVINLKYNLHGRLIHTDEHVSKIRIVIDETFVAITSKWPDKLPTNLPFQVNVISTDNIGEPSMWRIARYVARVDDDKLFFLKLMPKDLINGVNHDGQMDRVYKENDNQMKCKSEYVISAICGEEGNYIWSLQEVAEHGSLLNLKEILPNKIIPEYIALYIFKQIALGVKTIHSKHIYHNFLQLNIILIDKYFNIKISDFGASIDKDHFTPFEKNYFENLLPTFLNYKSKMIFPPEWNNHVVYNNKTDIWALGNILLKLVSETGDISHVSEPVKKLIQTMLDHNPDKRPSIDAILTSKVLTPINLSNKLSLNNVTKEIKLWLFCNYFMNTYKDTFHFNKKKSNEYIEQYIKEYLLSFSKSFAYDKNTGWDPIRKTFRYHDQVTIYYNSINSVYISEFDSYDYFEIKIKDLLADILPSRYHKYISQQQWMSFKTRLAENLQKQQNKHYVTTSLKHFEYKDFENGGEKTFESLPSENLLSNGKTLELSGNKNVLSLLIKISKTQAGILNNQGRVLSNGQRFTGTSFYIPSELCEKDIISNIMGTALSEYSICRKKFEESYCYLTVRVNNVKPFNKQGIVGWHADGAWGEQTYRHNNDIETCMKTYTGYFSDRNYIIQSAPEIKTPIALLDISFDKLRSEALKKFNNGEITLLPTEKMDDDTLLHLYLTHNVHDPPFQPPLLSQYFDKLVEENKNNKSLIVELPANKLNFFTAYTVHNVPPNNTKKTIRRCTVRIAFSSDFFDKACGPTINPVMGIPGVLRFFPYTKPYSINKNITLHAKHI